MKLEVRSSGDHYDLTAAVLVYTNSATRHAFASKHVVTQHAGRARIAPGTPLTAQDYQTLVQALAPRERPAMRWCDPQVLARGLGRLLWWAPPMQRSLFFRSSAQHPDSFDGRGRCGCPGLVFLAAERQLFVYALRGAAAPTRDTALYQAPFFNVWSSGEVCIGNAPLPPIEDEDPGAWERMFFRSHFTHPNVSEPDRLTVGVEPAQFWQARLAQPDAAFPEQVLFALPLRVEALMQLDLRERLAALPRAHGEI